MVSQSKTGKLSWTTGSSQKTGGSAETHCYWLLLKTPQNLNIVMLLSIILHFLHKTMHKCNFQQPGRETQPEKQFKKQQMEYFFHPYGEISL